jgi:hypothetical protein
LFPGSTNALTMEGSYISKEKLGSVDLLNSSGKITFHQVSTGSGGLAEKQTCWVAIAPVYDDYQIGELQKYESMEDYVSLSDNYVVAGKEATITPNFQLIFAKINKRITGARIYLAIDSGDTRLTGRVNPYCYVAQKLFTDTGWKFTLPDKYSNSTITIKQTTWNEKGLSYLEDSGMIETETDTSYAYSMRTVLGKKHLLSNVYVASSGIVDRQNIFTNPLGGSAINAGIEQVSLFPNEEQIYKKRCEPSVGSKINAILITGIEDVLVLKDRGVLALRTYVNSEGDFDYSVQVIDHLAGCSTINQAKQSNDGWIYFAGYDDVYRYRQGNLDRLIERQDYQDWLHTYRETITKTYKESCCMWVLPNLSVHFDFGQVGWNFAFYPNGGWRDEAFKQTAGVAGSYHFKWITQLLSGTVLGAEIGGTIVQFSNPTTGAFYYNDSGTPILATLDTGHFLPSGSEALDFVWDKIVLGKTIDVATVGNSEFKVYREQVLLRTDTGLDRGAGFVQIHSHSDEGRIGNEWRFIWNSDEASPEQMQSSGEMLQINGIYLYGDFIPREQRTTETTSAITKKEGEMPNTVGGLRYVVLSEITRTFLWDIPFDSADYQIITESARVADDSNNPMEEVTIVSKDAISFLAKASADNTYFRFRALP